MPRTKSQFDYCIKTISVVIEQCARICSGRFMRKRKKKVFRATKAVKAAAREQIGSPPPTRLVPDKKRQASEKHKPTLGKMLGEPEP
jgi:hypothetical protein